MPPVPQNREIGGAGSRLPHCPLPASSPCCRWRKIGQGHHRSPRCPQALMTALKEIQGRLAGVLLEGGYGQPRGARGFGPVPYTIDDRKTPFRPPPDSPNVDPPRRPGPPGFGRRRPNRSIPSGIRPFLYRDGGSAIHDRDHLKRVHQPAHARQSQPQATGSGKTIAQRLRYIGNSRAVIPGHNFDSNPAVERDGLKGNLAQLGVHDDVARELGNGGGDQGQVRCRKSRCWPPVPSPVGGQ